MLLGIVRHLLMEEIKEAPAGGAPESKQSATPPATPPAETVQKAGEVTVDDYGYELTPEQSKAAEGQKTADAKKSEQSDPAISDEIKEPVGGYGKEAIAAPQDETEKKVEPPLDDKAKAAALEAELGYKIETKGLPEVDAKKIIEFAKAHKLSKEAAQQLMDTKKSEFEAFTQSQDQAQKEYTKQIATQKASWDKELRTDPKFGGDNFAKNLNRADKVLNDFFTETKKVLTERKSMLPPYVMRDLANAYDHLYGSEKFTQGGKVSADKSEDKQEENNPLDFYT